MAKKYGVDVSEHNGKIDLSGNDFVIIRASWGTNTDKLFNYFYEQCISKGIPVGVYCYSYALDTTGAKSEAEYILNLINGKKIDVGVWFDMEDADGYKAKKGAMNASLITSMCNTFCAAVQSAGYYTGIYTASSWIGTYVNCSYDHWVANWGTNDGTEQGDTSNFGTMRQYTSVPMDKNVCYVDLDTYKSGGFTVGTFKQLMSFDDMPQIYYDEAVSRTGIHMPNCFTYSMARVNQAISEKTGKHTNYSLDGSVKVVGAGQLWEQHNDYFVQSQTPVPGALAIFKGGVAPYYYGHVTNVEVVGQNMVMSESSYQEFIFRRTEMSYAIGSYYPNGYGNLQLKGFLIPKCFLETEQPNPVVAQPTTMTTKEDITNLDALAKENKSTIKDGTYQILCYGNERYVLDVNGGKKANGTNVQIYKANGTKSQLFKVTHDDIGYITLKGVGSCRVLDVDGAKIKNNSNVQIYDSNGSRAQKWIAVKAGKAYKLISALKQGYVLDIYGAEYKNSANVCIHESNEGDNQRFIFE